MPAFRCPPHLFLCSFPAFSASVSPLPALNMEQRLCQCKYGQGLPVCHGGDQDILVMIRIHAHSRTAGYIQHCAVLVNVLQDSLDRLLSARQLGIVKNAYPDPFENT